MSTCMQLFQSTEKILSRKHNKQNLIIDLFSSANCRKNAEADGDGDVDNLLLHLWALSISPPRPRFEPQSTQQHDVVPYFETSRASGDYPPPFKMPLLVSTLVLW